MARVFLELCRSPQPESSNGPDVKSGLGASVPESGPLVQPRSLNVSCLGSHVDRTDPWGEPCQGGIDQCRSESSPFLRRINRNKINYTILETLTHSFDFASDESHWFILLSYDENAVS